MNRQLINRVIFLLSILGLGVSAFLVYEYSLPTPVFCPIGGSGCETVRNSPYSSFFGLPLPLMGSLFYLTIGFLTVIKTSIKSSLLYLFQFLFSIVAVLFGTYLTYLEIFVILAICVWCVLSFIISIGILILSYLDWKKADEN